MTPCLRDGQLVWTIRCRSDRSLRRGAVVAVDSRELGFRIVKRIVGLPGEHLRFEGSELWVDGRPVAEPYAIHSSFRGTFDVPEGHYLLLGDNRVASNDAVTGRLTVGAIRRHLSNTSVSFTSGCGETPQCRGRQEQSSHD